MSYKSPAYYAASRNADKANTILTVLDRGRQFSLLKYAKCVSIEATAQDGSHISINLTGDCLNQIADFGAVQAADTAKAIAADGMEHIDFDGAVKV